MKNILFFIILSTCLIYSSCIKIKNTKPQSVDFHDQYSGQSARDLLSDDKYKAINVQIQYMPGHQLESATIANLQVFLEKICRKPDGITINQTQINESKSSANLSEIQAMEQNYRTIYTTGNTLAVYVLVTDGYYTLDNVINADYAGIAYQNTSICLFGKVFAPSNLTNASKILFQTKILKHEFGHLMGLVNLGSPMQTQHESTSPHPHHCTNATCIMYHNSGTSGELCENCIDDLRANGSL